MDDRIGISQSAYAQQEQATRPRKETWLKIANAFGVAPEASHRKGYITKPRSSGFFISKYFYSVQRFKRTPSRLNISSALLNNSQP